MYISKIPRKVTDLLALPDPAPETVKDSVSQHVSLSARDSFSEISHPSALDKMLLPASPRLDSSAVEGNFEKQMKKELKIASGDPIPTE